MASVFTESVDSQRDRAAISPDASHTRESRILLAQLHLAVRVSRVSRRPVQQLDEDAREWAIGLRFVGSNRPDCISCAVRSDDSHNGYYP